MSYKKIGLTQCVNIMNEGITKCMIMYDQIQRVQGQSALFEGIFNLNNLK